MELATGLFLLLLTPVGFNLFPVQTVAELDFSYANDEKPLGDHHPSEGGISEVGESFILSKTAQITSAEFLLFRIRGNPTVNVFAVIYMFDERTSVPHRELAVSKPINASSLPDGEFGATKAAKVFTFEFENGPILPRGRAFAVALRTGSSGFIDIYDGSVWVGSAENIYPGIPFFYSQGSYHNMIDDFVFRVNGRVPSPS